MNRRTFVCAAGTLAAGCIGMTSGDPHDDRDTGPGDVGSRGSRDGGARDARADLPDGYSGLSDAGTLSTGYQRRAYAADDTDFPNPERGLSENHLLTSSYGRDQPRAFRGPSDAATRLVRYLPVIHDFRTSRVSDAFIEHLYADCDRARSAGVKFITRFSYWFNVPEPTYDAIAAMRAGVTDTSRDWILRHIEQLAPFFSENYDVIAYAETGFIGAWGEWNKSSNNLGDETRPQDTDSQRTIAFALQDALGERRMTAVRYLGRKRAFFGDEPLARDELFSGTRRARMGGTNDYLGSDYGGATDRSYFASDNLGLPYGGEGVPSSFSDQVRGERGLEELRTFHWTNLQSPGGEFLASWEEAGVWDDIRRGLGYRLRLTESRTYERVRAGGSLLLELDMANDGFASVFNPRPLVLVLRRDSTERRVAFTDDVRRLLPLAGETTTLSLSGTLPIDLASGDYQLHLHLPDEAPRLASDPRYAIRLANEGLWDAETGLHDLQLTLTVV